MTMVKDTARSPRSAGDQNDPKPESTIANVDFRGNFQVASSADFFALARAWVKSDTPGRAAFGSSLRKVSQKQYDTSHRDGIIRRRSVASPSPLDATSTRGFLCCSSPWAR
jgi:hypothetical protein